MSLHPDDSLRLQAVSSEANPPVGFPFVSLMIQNMYALTYRYRSVFISCWHSFLQQNLTVTCIYIHWILLSSTTFLDHCYILGHLLTDSKSVVHVKAQEVTDVPSSPTCVRLVSLDVLRLQTRNSNKCTCSCFRSPWGAPDFPGWIGSKCMLNHWRGGQGAATRDGTRSTS